MRVWIEVIKDLYAFVLGRDVALPSPDTQPALPAHQPIKMLEHPDPDEPRLTSAHHEKPHEIPDYSEEPAQTSTPFVNQEILNVPEYLYVCVPHTHCFLRPVRAFDTVIATFAYGDRVSIGGFTGRWASVSKNGITGWVLKDALCTDKELVFPTLESGVVYDAEHPETKKLRLAINDEFAAADLSLPLESVEYVWYRLKEAGRTPLWPQKRPRTAGRWQQLLRGVKRVHIGVRPLTNSVVEYVAESGEGVVLYVEAVKPDESLEVSGIDIRVPGRFMRQTISKQDWQAWRPVFIELT